MDKWMDERFGRMPGSHGVGGLFTPYPMGEPSVQWEHAHGGAGAGMDTRVGWQPKQQGAGVGSALGAPLDPPVLQQLPRLKPSCLV